jgi:hypothetical protein
MYRNLIPPFIGVFTSFFALWQLHKFMLVDNCLDHGGSYQYTSGKCLIETGNFLVFNLTAPLLIFYFIIGLIVSLIVAGLARKLFRN